MKNCLFQSYAPINVMPGGGGGEGPWDRVGILVKNKNLELDCEDRQSPSLAFAKNTTVLQSKASFIWSRVLETTLSPSYPGRGYF